jgi:PAS domain-containing protein
MVGQPITKVIPPDRQKEEPAILERLKRGERIDHFETVRVRKDGSLIDVSLTISPVRRKDGVIVGASKIARDITVQKNLYQALQENEQRLQIAVKAAELGTWEFNNKTDEVKYSRRYLEIMGFDANESPSHTELISRIHPKDRYIRDNLL